MPTLNNRSDIKKILVTRTDKLGDVILTLPVISQLKKKFPDAKIFFLVSNYVKDLIENYEGIDELIYLEDYPTLSSKKKYFKSQYFDLAVNVFPRFEIALAMYLSGIKIRIGSGYRWYSFLYNHKIFEHRKYADKHEADYNLNLLRPVIRDIDYEKKYYFRYTNDETSNLGVKLSAHGFNLSCDFIIIHPASKGSALDLPLEKFQNLCTDLLKNFKDVNIVLTGTNDDSDKTKNLVNGINFDDKKRVFDLSGLLNLRELMILIDKSKLFISNSTGPIHIAGALNKNIIGFYPNKIPMNAERWKPLSVNAVIIKPAESDDMSSISNKEIIDKISFILNKQ